MPYITAGSACARRFPPWWWRGRWGLLLAVALVLFVVAAIAGGCSRGGPPGAPGGQQGEPGPQGPPGPEGPPGAPEVPQRPCPLCGQQVPENLVHRRPFALMIDNAPQARPQSGLADACLVYEMLAEGGITRFLAFYLHQDPLEAGPVRSARPYFLDLVLPLDAVLGHAGASEQGFADLRALGVPHLDEIHGGGEAYWRAPPSQRKPPHATYTSGERFRAAMARHKLDKEGPFPSPFPFRDARKEKAAGKEAVLVTVWYPGGWQGYRVSYAYEKDADRWLRSMNDESHRDADGRPLWARNVIVQFVDMKQIPGDELLHMEANMTGQGKVLVFSGGAYREGTWRKQGRKSPVVYRDASGNPLELEPGPTWVLVVPVGTRFEVR